MAQHKQQKRSKKNAPKHARVSDVSKNSPSLGVVASVALASTLAIAPFSAAHALEAAASQAPDTTDNAPTPQSKAPAKAAAPHTKQVSFTVRDSDSNALPALSVFAVETKKPSPEKTSINPAVEELRSAVTSASGGPAASTPAPGSAQGSQPASSSQPASGSQPGSQPAPIPGAGGTSPSSPSTPTGAPDASTNKNAVITPNTNNTEANTQEGANAQVKREEDNKKTYTFTVTYCVEGYHQKQLLQPTEFTFTDDELTKISNPNDQGLYIPVVETKGYRAQRGSYVKENGKYILDTKKDASVQTYIKIDRTLIEAHKNTITSTDTNIISNFTVNYRPKTITYYVRHMLQDPNDPEKFIEFTGINEQITIKDKQGQSHTIRVSKGKGVVGQNIYAQPATIEGYTPEPNLINSPIPDDEDYSDDDDNNLNNPSLAKKHLVFELRYLLNKHEVSYDTQGGTAIQSKVFYYGMKVDAVPEPTRKGYKFDGWKKIEKKSAQAQNPSDPQTTGIDVKSTLLEHMPDCDVRFVAQWKLEKEKAEYHINIWVQKADLPKPEDPTNMDNYDFVGQVKKEGKSDGIIQYDDLNLTDDQIAHLAWPDKNLRGNIENQADFDKYFMEDQASEARTKALNNVEEPEYFGATKKRPLTKIRPDGTTVVNKVFNRRTYELIFANADIEKDGTTNKLFDGVNHITITKGDKEYNDTDKDKLYKVTYRFGQTIHYTSDFPTDAETKRYKTQDDDSPAFGLGWLVANDANKHIYIDTPPYRFDLNHFIAPQKDNKDFSQDNIRLFGEKLTPYQRVLVPDANNNGAGSIHVLVKLETEESARRNNDNNREYVASKLSYTKDDTLNSSYDYGAPTIEGFEPLTKKQNLTEKDDEDDYYNKLADELADVWKKDHPEEEDDPDGSDDEFREWVAQKFPHLVFTQEGSNGAELEENGLLIFKYKRKNVSVRFNIDEITQVKDSSGKQASIQEPYGANVRKFAGTYNEGIAKNPLAAGQHFASSYTFTLNGKTYTFSRPNNIPEDYEFAGWSLDPAGTNKLAATKADGTAYTAQELADLLKKSPEEIAKVLGNIPLETSGITLYASWKRVDAIHTIDVDMARPDALEHTFVKVKHAGHAKRAKLGVQGNQTTTEEDCFPAVADRPGYIFNGWMQQYIKPDGTTEWLPFAFSSPILEDLNIKAQWIEDKRVSGTMSHVFLREGYTAEDYKKAKADNNQEELKKMVADIQTNVLTNLRPRSSYAAEAVYRSGNYYPDHTYSTFMVSEDEKENNAEFVYTPYAIRRFTVHYKDAAGNELADPETFVSNKLEYDVAHAKVIPGYRLPNDKPLARQLNFTDSKNKETYIKPDANGNYSVEFIYDDVRILKRKDDTQVTPDNYSRVQFDTQTTELSMQNGKVISTPSHTDGGNLAPFNGTGTGDTGNTTNTLTFDIVKGTKAFEAPLPVPHAKEGYTFTGWTSKVVYAAGETAADGVNRLPVFSEEFPYKVVYTAHFTKTQIAFVGGDSTAEAPKGYYKVTYSADQNGRLSRQISDGHGGTQKETLDTLTNVVVVDKYKDNVIEAPTAVPDKGFEEKGDFEFKGRDSKDRSYVKHFVMIDPIAAEHRYILPDESVLKTNETAKDLIKNYTAYKNQADNLPGELAEYRFLDEKGNPVTKLDSTTPGEHKVFIEVIAGRAGQRVHKKVPYFYTVMPRSFLQGELSKYNADVVAAHYKKYTFKSRTANGIMTGRETAQTEGDYETLAAYVYAGTAAAPVDTYKLDVPLAAGHDFETKGYHYVFRGWKKVDGTSAGSAAPDTLPADFKWKNFKPDIEAKDHYKDIKPTDDAAYVAMYEKVPYVVEKSDDGTVPPDSVVVSFKPAAGRAWKDGKTGPKVLYIKKGVDISKIDEHGKPVTDEKQSILAWLGNQLYGYTGDWTKSSMEGIDQIDSMQKHGKALPAGTVDEAWKSNNAFQEFVAHQTQYTDPVGGVEKTIIKGTAAPAAIDFVKNADLFKPADGTPFESITAEYVKAPSTDAVANLTVPIKVTVKYKDSAEATHTREYNITGALHVLGDVLEKKNAPADPELTSKYTTITFVSKKAPVVDVSGHETGQKEEPGQVSGATEGTEQSELQYLAYKKDDANYTITIPQVAGKDYEANGYHYVFTGWKKVQSGAHAQEVLLNANQRTLSFDAQENVIYEAQYKKVPYVVEKSDDGTVPPDSVVVSFKPAAGRAWKDGSTGPKVLYIKKGVDISKIDQHGKPVTDEKQSILAWLGSQLYGYTDDWTKSSMEGITLIDSMQKHGKALPAGTADEAWLSNNAFQEFVAHQTPYTDPVGGVEKTIIKGTAAPEALDFVQNKDAFVPSETSTVESITAEYVKAPSTDAAANLTVPIKVTVKYKDSAEATHTREYNITGALHVLGDVLEKKNAPTEQTLKDQYTTITFVSKKQKVVDASGHETGKTEDPGQVSGATEGAEQSELEYLTFKKDGASYTIDVPKVSGKDYTENGYHYVFTGWKQVVTPASGVTPVTIGAADRNYTFDAKQNIVFEAQYKKVPYIVTKVTDGTIPEDSVVVSFKPAPGRKWADGSTGPKVLYIKKGMDISRLDKNGVPIKDTDTTTQSILQVLGSQLAGYKDDWSKSSMDGITLIDSMQKHGAGLAPGTADEAWKSNNAFQEFVAHQTPYVEPEAVSEFTITQNDTVPTLEEFIKNLAQLKGNNIAKDDQGKPIFKIETIGKMPTSKVAATYTIPWTVTLKHADMSDTITYKCTTVLRVMSDVYNATDANNMIKDITASETPDKQGKTTPLTPAQQKFKDSYARVVFKSYDKDTDKDTEKGTLSGGDNDTTLTRYVKINTDVDLSIPGVNPKQKLDDHDGKGEYDYLFDHWEIQVKPTGNSAGASNGENTVSPAETPNNTNIHGRRSKRSVDVFPQTMLFAANGTGADAPTEGTTVVAGATNKELAASLRRLKRQFDQTYPNVTYEIIARYKKVYYVTSAKDFDSVPAGFVPVVAFPAPGHTWEDGSVDPDIYYVKSGESYGAKRQEWERGLANLKGWKYLGADGKVITDPQVLASIDKPTKALTLIAEQYDLPELKPKNNVVITEGDTMPSYNEMVEDDGVKTFTTLNLNPRFAGWEIETPENGYKDIKTDKPGIYRVHFDLKYYTDEQEIDPKTKQPVVENGKVKHKVAVKRVDVNVHVLPRVIAAQNAPAAGTPEAKFIKENYTKVMYRVAMHEKGGRITSPYTTFYVRRGYTIDPNALLYFNKDARADHTKGNEEIGVPGTAANAGYTFYDWQKVDANEKGDVVYLARFRKLPIAHFMLETSTEAEQPFSTRLIGDAQNHPIYKPKPGTKLPDGVTVTCDGATCKISGTPHITDWKPGETEREIELRFEAVDQRVTYDEHGKEQPGTDKYGRSSYGIHKEIVVKLVVKRPPEKTDDGAGSGGGYWYPKDGRYDHEPERSIVREVPGSKGGDQLVPASDQPPAGAQPNAHPTFENGTGICSTARTSDKGCYYAGERAPRHAKESLPKTSDVPSRPLLELVAGSGIALIGTAFIAKRKKKNKHTK